MNDAATEFVEAAVRRYDEELNRAGFRTTRCGESPADWSWVGHVEPEHEELTVSLKEGFPFAAPRVALPARAGTADWHQTADGVLCLWDTHAQGDLPWLDAAELLGRVQQWIRNAADGWVADAPQLDLEAYKSPRVITRRGQSVLPILIIDRWADLADHWFRATMPTDTGLMELKGYPRRTPPATSSVRSRRRRRGRGRPDRFVNGIAVDLGEMTHPLIPTDDLLDALGVQTPTVGGLLTAGRPVLVAARYSRAGVHGLMGFWLEPQGDGVIRGCLPVVEREASQHRRAGWHASSIADRTVTVIGAGSIGSYVADLLHRSGVHDLHVHDSDLLLPGNLVRHAASAAQVGAMKADAVRDTAAQRDPSWPITARPRINSLAEAVELLRDRDLVVDCTGDRRIWHLMRAAADIAGKSFVHVAVMGHGQYGRVDICPPLDGAEPLDEDPVVGVALTEWEGGCGDPVSPTPPIAVLETAAMGARFALRMLAGEQVPPAGESRALFPDVA